MFRRCRIQTFKGYWVTLCTSTGRLVVEAYTCSVPIPIPVARAGFLYKNASDGERFPLTRVEEGG